MGVLYDALRFKAREATLNCLVGELALQLAPLGADIRAAHIWSERNQICDALSRLQDDSEPDAPQLRGAQRVRRRPTPRRLLDTMQQL